MVFVFSCKQVMFAGCNWYTMYMYFHTSKGFSQDLNGTKNVLVYVRMTCELMNKDLFSMLVTQFIWHC